MASEGLHEESLPESVKDYHRVIQSTIEELEAVDWYNQRAAASKDQSVKAIMEHNRDEEIEHACMGLEWLRRNSPKWDAMMREFLFSEGDIVATESSMKGGDGESKNKSSTNGSLKIGKNK